MTFTLTVEMDNAAFTPDYPPELVRILRELASRINRDRREAANGSLRDINGNTVARFRVTD